MFAKNNKSKDLWWTPDSGAALLKAIAKKNVPEILRLLYEGADARYKDVKTGSSPLHIAAERGLCVEVIQALALGISEADGKPLLDNAGQTALHRAAARGQVQTTTALLTLGAQPNLSDFTYLTPLHLAAQGGHVAVAKLLLRYGASPILEDEHGNLPLHIAAKEAISAELIRTLAAYMPLDYCNHRCDLARTPLWVACYYGNVGAAKILLEEYKVDPRITGVPEGAENIFSKRAKGKNSRVEVLPGTQFYWKVLPGQRHVIRDLLSKHNALRDYLPQESTLIAEESIYSADKPVLCTHRTPPPRTFPLTAATLQMYDALNTRENMMDLATRVNNCCEADDFSASSASIFDERSQSVSDCSRLSPYRSTSEKAHSEFSSSPQMISPLSILQHARVARNSESGPRRSSLRSLSRNFEANQPLHRASSASSGLSVNTTETLSEQALAMHNLREGGSVGAVGIGRATPQRQKLLSTDRSNLQGINSALRLKKGFEIQSAREADSDTSSLRGFESDTGSIVSESGRWRQLKERRQQKYQQHQERLSGIKAKASEEQKNVANFLKSRKRSPRQSSNSEKTPERSSAKNSPHPKTPESNQRSSAAKSARKSSHRKVFSLIPEESVEDIETLEEEDNDDSIHSKSQGYPSHQPSFNQKLQNSKRVDVEDMRMAEILEELRQMNVASSAMWHVERARRELKTARELQDQIPKGTSPVKVAESSDYKRSGSAGAVRSLERGGKNSAVKRNSYHKAAETSPAEVAEPAEFRRIGSSGAIRPLERRGKNNVVDPERSSNHLEESSPAEVAEPARYRRSGSSGAIRPLERRGKHTVVDPERSSNHLAGTSPTGINISPEYSRDLSIDDEFVTRITEKLAAIPRTSRAPVSVPKPARLPHEEELAVWLEHIECPEVLPNFLEKGYTVAVIFKKGLSDEELDDLEIAKVVTRKRIINAINSMERSPFHLA